MKIVVHGDTLNVSDIRELATATAITFQSELSAALSSSHVRQIDLDLSQTSFVDCGGLGALVAIRKKASNGHTATVRLLNPPKPLQHMVNLMKMTGVFPMETSETTGTPVS